MEDFIQNLGFVALVSACNCVFYLVSWSCDVLTLAATSMTQVPLGFSPQLCTDLILHSLSPLRLLSDALVSSRSDLVPITNSNKLEWTLLLAS